ncbi:isoform 2 of ankyrin repeat domain-containing protein 17 [Fagus crenata]
MLKENSTVATFENKDNETALHVLATKPSAFDSGNQLGILRRCINSCETIKQDQNSKQTEAHQLVKNICAHAYKDDVENFRVNEEISQVLFVAAKVGNVEFFIEVIRTDVDLIWKMDTQERTIFHIAVEERHESIFNILVNEIGSIKDILLDITTKDGNNMLHLAAKLAPEHKLNAISGAALQMQQELLWFKVIIHLLECLLLFPFCFSCENSYDLQWKEVQKVVRPSFKEMKNKEEQTPNVLFAKQHEGLKKDGEKWMRKAATSSMIIATLIGGIMFIGQLIFSGQPADGVNHSSDKSNLVPLQHPQLIMFLSILTSGYSYDDFLVLLPNMLLIGVTSLFISIAIMMVAFSASFCLKYPNHHGFTLIGLFACLPILYGLLK